MIGEGYTALAAVGRVLLKFDLITKNFGNEVMRMEVVLDGDRTVNPVSVSPMAASAAEEAADDGADAGVVDVNSGGGGGGGGHGKDGGSGAAQSAAAAPWSWWRRWRGGGALASADAQ